MSELGFDGGEVARGGRPDRAGRLPRPLLVLAVAILCGSAYLAGIWSRMSTDFSCVTTRPGVIVCGSVTDAPIAPAPPETPAQNSGSV